MGLESGTFVSDLVDTNPAGNDPKSQGDNHLRLIKGVLQGTFPNASKAFYLPTSEAKNNNFSVGASDQNRLFVITTSGGAVTATLPELVEGDAGWECSFVKVGSGVNPYFVTPTSGTLRSGSLSGLAKTRRCIPGMPCRAIWTGGEWIITRAARSEVGVIEPFDGSDLPVGYEWPNGQTLASASSNYPDYNARKGSGATRDLRQRFIAGHNLGGSDAGRLTGQSGGVDGDTLGNTGGAETHTLTSTQAPAHTHTFSDTVSSSGTAASAGSHIHGFIGPDNGAAVSRGTGSNFTNRGTMDRNTDSGGAHTHSVTVSGSASGTTSSSGSGGAHNNIPPVIILGFILVVE